MALEQLDKEDASDPSDTDQTDMTDHTGKASFDFTKELNRLNEGGAHQSFVEQLENALKTPVQALTYHSDEDMPPIPALDVARMMEGGKVCHNSCLTFSISIEADTISKQHAHIARARANHHVRLSRNDSVLLASSFGSVRNPGVSEPFNYSNAANERASMEYLFMSKRILVSFTMYL